ncbi:hypothetical protein Tco_0465664 [Tanacetum coccineum]
MEKGSSVGGNSGGKPLKFILKKSSYTPPNNIAAAVAVNDTIVGNATAGCRPSNAATARVEHGINRTTNEGNPKDYDGVRNVLEPVVNVDEAEYPTLDSANVGANMANMAHTKVSTNDMFGVSNVTPDIDEIGEFTIGNMPSGADSCTATTVGFNSPHATPFSFANILNSEHYCKKLNFRTLVNDEHLESYDFVLPKLAVDSVKNRYENSLVGYFVGTPIMLDTFTSSMCIESWGRISFACALVEISSDKDLKKEVTMAVPNEDLKKEVTPSPATCRWGNVSPATCRWGNIDGVSSMTKRSPATIPSEKWAPRIFWSRNWCHGGTRFPSDMSLGKLLTKTKYFKLMIKS